MVSFRTPRYLAVGLVALFSVGLGSGLTALAADPSVTYYACNAKGTLYNVSTTQLACKSGDMSMKWDQVGPAGPAGPQGPKGDTGPAGAAGPQGPTGDQGPQGVQGLKGDTGDQGLQGLPGDKGDKGDQGLPGPQGEQGIAGAQGTQGVQGPPGLSGWEIVQTNYTPVDPQGSLGIYLKCPAGKKVLGGGPSNVAPDYGHVSSSMPVMLPPNTSQNPTPAAVPAWYVQFQNTAAYGSGQTMSVAAFATCANVAN